MIAAASGLYLCVRVQALWDEYEGGSLAAWLPGFYGAVAAAAAAEARWMAGALPEDHPALLLRLLAALFARLEKPCRARLASALSQGAPKFKSLGGFFPCDIPKPARGPSGAAAAADGRAPCAPRIRPQEGYAHGHSAGGAKPVTVVVTCFRQAW